MPQVSLIASQADWTADHDVASGPAEQEKVVQDLLRDAEALKAFWTPVVAVLCVVTAM